MVHPWAVIVGAIPLFITYNFIWFTIIEKKTKYKGNTQGDMTNTPLL